MKLSDKIWITRKSRINASARLEKFDFFSQFLITYYSTIIVIASILSVYKEGLDLSPILISLSILILALSLFIGTRGFKERSISFKNCYIRLNRLIKKAECLEKQTDNNCGDEFKKIQDEYDDILLLFENHKKIDYLKTVYEADNTNSDNFQLTWKQKAYFWSYNIFSVVFLAILLAIPFLIYFFVI